MNSTLNENPWYQSRSFLLLAVVVLFFLQILIQGYICFRGDHQSHIPLVWQMHDPDLFPRDWFFQEHSPLKLRFYHVLMIATSARILGIGAGIFVLYAAFSCMSILAWLKISRRIYQSYLPGMIAALLAFFYYRLTLGGNYVMEYTLVPRVEAATFMYWGLYFVLCRRHLPATLLFAAAGYIQPAVGAYVLAMCLVWILVRDRGRSWKTVLMMAVLFGACVYPHLQWLREDLGGGSRLTVEEEVHFAAFIRHPHHMVPGFWVMEWALFAGLLALFVIQYKKAGKDRPALRDLGNFAMLIVAFLAIMTVLVVAQVREAVLLQPYRLAVPLYLVFYLFLAPRILEMLRDPRILVRARAFALLFLGLVKGAAIVIVAFEALLAWAEYRNHRVSQKISGGLLLLIVLAAMTVPPDADEAQTLVLWVVALTALLTLITRRGWLSDTRKVQRAMTAAAGIGVLWSLSYFVLPYEAIISSTEKSSTRKRIAEMSLRYQIKPMPLYALERVAVWAETNTPKDALFLAPPRRVKPGWNLWSKRSVFFAVKFFPFRDDGIPEWKRRYLTVYGARTGDEAEREAAMAKALNDQGATDVDEYYESLSADEILTIARREKIDYVVTRTHYDDPRLELLHQDWSRFRSKPHDGDVAYLYRVVPVQPARTGDSGT